MNSDNDAGSAVLMAMIAGLVLWFAGRLGLPASVEIFIYFMAGVGALYVGLYLLDTVWLAIKGRGAKRDEPRM